MFAYLSGHGYVGLGEVIAEAVPQQDFVPPGQSTRLIELPLTAMIRPERWQDPEKCDWCAAVRWTYAVDRHQAVLRSRFPQPTFPPIKQPALVEELLAALRTASTGGVIASSELVPRRMDTMT